MKLETGTAVRLQAAVTPLLTSAIADTNNVPSSNAACFTIDSQRSSAGWKNSKGSQHLLKEVHELVSVSVFCHPRQRPERLDVTVAEEKKTSGKQNLFPFFSPCIF